LSASAANLITNPDFTTNLDGWIISSGDGSATFDETSGDPASPSLRVAADGTTTDTSVESECITVDDSSNVDLILNIKGTAGFAIATIDAFSDPVCMEGLVAINSESFPATGAWDTYTMTDVTLPDGTHSAKVVLTAAMGSSTSHGDANFDHVAFGPSGTALGFVNINQEGLTGTWYNPLTSGQGMQFQVSPDDSNPGEGTLFGAWYTYDIVAGTENSQRWYSIQTSITGDAQSADVAIYQNTGGNFNAGPITSAVQVGTGTLTFDSCSTGSFAYSLDDGRAGTIPLLRLLPNVECVESGTPTNPPSDFGLSGAWYNTATSGQGLMIEIDPTDTEAFLGWYSYAAAGESAGAAGQRWFSAQAPYTVGTRTMDLTIYASTGGVFDSSSGPVATVPVGTATLTFTSCTNATFDYIFTDGELNGSSGTIPLTRLGAAPVSCAFPPPN